MNVTKKTLLSAALIATLSTGFLAAHSSPVFAASATEVNADMKAQQADKDFIKVSDDALIGMQNVHDARLAIFNGNQNTARTFVDAALTRMDSAVSEADQYAVDVSAAKSQDQFVPVDAYITVLDSFETVQNKADHIAKANQHLTRGQQNKAIETLKLGDVDVAVTTQLVPVKFAQSQIKMASKLIDEGKYYQANLALKAVDDATIVQTLSVDQVPQATS